MKRVCKLGCGDDGEEFEGFSGDEDKGVEIDGSDVDFVEDDDDDSIDFDDEEVGNGFMSDFLGKDIKEGGLI